MVNRRQTKFVKEKQIFLLWGSYEVDFESGKGYEQVSLEMSHQMNFNQ